MNIIEKIRNYNTILVYFMDIMLLNMYDEDKRL